MKEIFSISSGTNIAKAKPAISTGKEAVESGKTTSSKDFLAVMFAQIKESLSAKENNLNLDIAAAELLDIKTSTKVSLPENGEKKSIDEHLLGDLLEVISILKGGSDTKISFPTLSQSLEKLINSDVAIKELKEVNSLSDLLKLSKKYDLGLEKISVKKLDVESLKKEFPNLDKKSFFEMPKETKNVLQKNTEKTTEIRPANLSFRDIQKPMQKIEKEPSILERVISTSKTKEESLNMKESITKIVGDAKEVKVIGDAKEVKKEIKVIGDAKEVKKEIKVIDDAKKDVKIVQNKNMVQEIKKIASNAPEVLTKVVLVKDTKDLVKSATIKLREKEIKLSDNTRVNTPKIENKVHKKSLIESVLQGVRTDKPVQNEKVNLQNAQQAIEKSTPTESSQTEISETKVDTSAKVEIKVPIKTDAPALKNTNATRETFSNFANELREKIENYKPPIMKVQMALNPKALGEVDVTIVTRGNSLHVNITSNTNSMSLFTQNQAEFKNSLVNMGFTNLEMNFTDQKERDNQQNENKSAHKDFGDDLENQELEDETARVELIIPQYV